MQSTEQLPCGNGVKKSSRTCSDPFPAHGGHHCAGNSILFHPCDAGECPGKKHKTTYFINAQLSKNKVYIIASPAKTSRYIFIDLIATFLHHY